MNWIPDVVKKTVNDAVTGLVPMIVAPPTKSQFIEKGILTADEFVKAGDKLITNCGAWKWYPVADKQYLNKYLPEQKQFLGIENVICRRRCKDLNTQGDIVINDGEDEIIITKNENEKLQQIEADERFYNLYVCYDLYYFTPRLYLAGKNSEGQPLPYEKVKEDINVEYADKTVTEEQHPQLNLRLPTIHPCKHADTLKFMTQQMLENGADASNVQIDNAIIIFLKFMGSVIPTIQFDFVTEIVMN